MNIQIRSYKTEDKPLVMEIFDENVPQYFDISERSGLDKYLDEEIELYYVIEANEQLLAAGGINFEAETAIISWDLIHPRMHYKGLGTKLLQYRIAQIKEISQIKQLRVRTSQHTHVFYEKNGFRTEKIVKDYWAPGFDLYLMYYQL